MVLGVRGRSAGAHGHTDHRVWNRAVWSPLGASRRLLRLVGAVFGPAGVVVLGLEETIERRRGANITAQGLDRDPVRSSRAHVVNVSGRRWRCGRRLPPRSGAHRVWALPVMTGRCASAPVDEPQDRRAHTRVPRAWQLIQVVVRGRPGRVVVCVADSREAAVAWRHQVRTGAVPVSAPAWVSPPPARIRPPTRAAGHIGRPACREPGVRPWRPDGPMRQRRGSSGPYHGRVGSRREAAGAHPLGAQS